MGTVPISTPAQVQAREDDSQRGVPFTLLKARDNGHSPAAQKEQVTDDLVLIATSPKMRDVRSQVRQIADFDIPVLLLGESGTGKSIVARMIHNLSRRSRRTFMKVNCAALPADLLESELFGHEAGAFTGASLARPGKFQVSDKGTILLDEVGEIPIGLQAKLLHVLQDGEFSRLGSTSTTKVDVRVIAATNRNIQEDIAAGKFREDLYYRLNAYTIQLPPLSERREDIPELMVYFMAYWAAKFEVPMRPFSAAMYDACVNYSWPGNIRELENLVKRFLIVSDETQALSQLDVAARGDAEGLGNNLQGRVTNAGLPPTDLKLQMRSMRREAEREAIARALELTQGSRKRAAEILNISVRSLQYKLRQFGMNRPHQYPGIDASKNP